MTTPTPLTELARGGDMGRRLARLEERLGGRAVVHWATTRDGLMHARMGPACRACPPAEHRQVELTPNGYLALVSDTRPELVLTPDELADRACALGYRPLPGRTPVDPTGCVRCGTHHPAAMSPSPPAPEATPNQTPEQEATNG